MKTTRSTKKIDRLPAYTPAEIAEQEAVEAAEKIASQARLDAFFAATKAQDLAEDLAEASDGVEAL